MDANHFQSKLDELLNTFRGDTLQHFLNSKQKLSVQQSSTIEAERRRCNAMLSLKQSELETLRENLAKQTKMSEEYRVRSEIMALWAGSGKTIGRIRTLQMRCFLALKKYREFKKHSETVLKHKLLRFKQDQARKVFQAWHKTHRVWKQQKD